MTDMRDVEYSYLTAVQPPENSLEFQSYDIYHKLSRKERAEMQKQIQEDTVKFSAELDDKVLPTMPNTKHSTVLGKRNFLGIVANRQARLQAQIDWLRREQERNRREEDV